MQTVAAAVRVDHARADRGIPARARRRRDFVLAMTGVLALMYAAFLLLVATGPGLLARNVAPGVSLAIVSGTAMIVLSWVLTCVYVLWMNRAESRGMAR